MRRALVLVGLAVFLMSTAVWAQIVGPSSAFPDLVVLKVTYDWFWEKDFQVPGFSIVIKNIGSSAASIPTKVAVLALENIYKTVTIGGSIESSAAKLIGTADVLALAAGASATVVVKPVYGSGYLVLVLADAPVPGKPLGQLNEYGLLVSATGANPGEMNNAFMFPLGTGVKKPAVFENPAF